MGVYNASRLEDLLLFQRLKGMRKLEVMSMFIIVTVVIVSWIYTFAKFIVLDTFHVCRLCYVNYTSNNLNFNSQKVIIYKN